MLLNGTPMPVAIYNADFPADAAVAITKMATRHQSEFPQRLTDFRVHDALQTPLPGTAASDDLGLVGAAPADAGAAPVVTTGDVKNLGATTRRARIVVPLDSRYVAAGTVVVKILAGMVTTVASATATLDVEVRRVEDDGTLSSDLVTTSATDINTPGVEFNEYSFAVTSTTLAAGDILDIRVTLAVDDTATVTAVIASIVKFFLCQDVK